MYTVVIRININNNALNFGDDNLDGGAGDDTVVGDVETIRMEYTDGSTSGPGITNDDDNWVYNNEFNFGDDTLNGGRGNDNLTGDVRFIEIDGTSYDLSSSADVTALQLTSEYGANTFAFGSDTFVFDASANFGHDTVTDFGSGGVADILSITGLGNFVAGGGVDINDLLAVSHVEDDGSGSIKLVVDTNNDGSSDSSITFLNINFEAGKIEINDYIDNADIIITG